jgi:hypothetical protein
VNHPAEIREVEVNQGLRMQRPRKPDEQVQGIVHGSFRMPLVSLPAEFHRASFFQALALLTVASSTWNAAGTACHFAAATASPAGRS